MLPTLWQALGGDPAAPAKVEIANKDAWLGGPLPVDELATGAVAAALLAAAELAAARGHQIDEIQLDAEHVALSFRSERYVLVGGDPDPAGFAPLSRFVRCADGGWARTHANYPHHAAALGRALGIDPATDPKTAQDELTHAARAITSHELEDRVFAEGGCAAAFRTEAEWSESGPGRVLAATPLIAFEDGLAHDGHRDLPALKIPTRPCKGIRVLDLTRVIAGPVAGRTLAALGADVLRVDPPQLPEIPAQHTDTGVGKRSASLDLSIADRREQLLAEADVVLMGYRPGALARLGLDGPGRSERHPHLVQVSLSAWGAAGPWTSRRGFDSLVQVATGIAAACAGEDGTPGALPAQALDHGTGHLIAATALRQLAARARGEQIRPASLALARTAKLLLDAPRPAALGTDATNTAQAERYRVTFGDVSLIGPPGTLDGEPLRWPHGPHPLGSDPAAW